MSASFDAFNELQPPDSFREESGGGGGEAGGITTTTTGFPMPGTGTGTIGYGTGTGTIGYGTGTGPIGYGTGTGPIGYGTGTGPMAFGTGTMGFGDRERGELRAPVAPYFYGKPISELTELERVQYQAYLRDLEEYNRQMTMVEGRGRPGGIGMGIGMGGGGGDGKQVVLYFDPAADQTIFAKNLIDIQTLLRGKGIGEMMMMDATKHPDLQSMLADTKKDFPNPLVVIRGSPVGGFRDLQRLEEAGKLDSLLSGAVSISDIFIQDPDAPELQLGAMGTVLNAGESLVSGVGSLLYLPVSILSWPFSSPQQPAPPPEGEEFTVVNTNWYGRELHRIFRFTATHVERVHPSTREVRESFPYQDITKVVCPDDKNLIIHYNNTEAYLRCPPKDIERIIYLLTLHYPGQLVIEKS